MTTRTLSATHRTNAFTLHRREHVSMASATVSGQVLGTAIGPNAEAEIGTAHGVQVEIVRDGEPLPRIGLNSGPR
jgi:hypothetical protein